MTSTEALRAVAPVTPAHGITFREAVKVWAKVAALSFGGPAGQIAVMHRILVEQKKWIGENRFLHALNFCMLLPGPEAQQLAIYIGWLLHKTKGGLVAGTLFVLPGFVCIMILSWIYAAYGNVGIVQALFFGLKAAVLAIVLEAVVRIGKRSLKNNTMIGSRRRGVRGDLLLFGSVPDHHSGRGRYRISRRPHGQSDVCGRRRARQFRKSHLGRR